VSRGQIAERMTVVQAGTAEAPIELEALWQPGVTGGKGVASGDAAMPVIIAGPHPRLGGNMDAPACAEIVWHLARRAHPTIRFNWRGTGASTGATRILAHGPGPVDDEVSDLERVVDHHAAGAPCAIVGVSFGSIPAIAVATRHPLVERVVLVAPPVASGFPFDLDALLASGVPVSVVAAAADTLAPLAAIEAAVARRARIEVVAGAGHTFTAGLVDLGRRVAAFLPGVE
jgi:alpha/beta superfamily hydrolase